MQKQKRILICPLDWGLGHATRCIPIIRLLLKKNAEVLVAADAGSLALLKQEFPQLTFIPFKGYDISYPEKGSMKMKMMLSIPKIVSRIKAEQKELDLLIDKYKIDVVISDNRYGCHSAKTKSILITHQLMIKAPIGEALLHKKVVNFIGKYDECWVPDSTSAKLSGDLAHKYPLPENTFFIGALSRFNAPTESGTKTYDVMAVVSGPEPQRSIFEKLVLEQLKKSDLKALLVCGKTETSQKTETIKNVTVVSHLPAEKMKEAILQSDIILSRSGYSTIMDLAVLGKKAIFVPTPGQTEQEYLGKLFFERGIAFSQAQAKFDLQKALEFSKKFKGFPKTETGNELEKRIDTLFL